MLDELADLLDTVIYGEIESKEDLLEEARRGEQSPTRYIAGEVPVEVGAGMRVCHASGRVFGEKLGPGIPLMRLIPPIRIGHGLRYEHFRPYARLVILFDT